MADMPPLPSLDPATAGFDPVALRAACALAAARETPFPHDLAGHIARGYFEAPPDNEILGPVWPRGEPNGLVLRHGAVVARWGDTRQADLTFSVAKSYLSLLAGVAVADGLIALDDAVSASVSHEAFRGPRNGVVTWRQLLTLSSEWEGTLFGKSETIDRGRELAREGSGAKGQRGLAAPGTFWEYNDVRVNALALALLLRFRRALPEVFAARVMRLIGASNDWGWHGYRTAWVDVDGARMQSVPGGSHWGGGLRICAEDQARLGQLMLQDGVWDGVRVLPKGWVAASVTPCALHADYGLLWWLNRSARYPRVPLGSFFASGAGGNLTWVEPERGIVAVLRWTDTAAFDAVCGGIAGAVV